MILYNKDIFKKVFCYRPKYWYKNIAQIPRYFRELHFLIKNGYSEEALWNVDCWFNDVMSKILVWYKDNRHGTPACEIIKGFIPETEEDFKKQETYWNNILNQMIVLLREANEETSQFKNPYQAEWSKAYDDFTEKYGMFGEGLATDEEKVELEPKNLRRWHTPSELPEYKDIMDKYMKSEIELSKYREQCKDDFFKLFSKYYYNLWD